MAEFWRSSELPFIEARRSCQQNTCYRLHSHDEFSIGAIDKGSSLFAGNLAGEIRLEPGDVIVIPAGHVHSCNPLRREWRYQMMHLDQQWVATLLEQMERGVVLSGVRIIRNQEAYEAVVHLFAALFADTDRRVVNDLVSQTLHRLGQAPEAQVVAEGADTSAMAKLAPVFDRLRDDSANPRICELAELVGMSEFALIRAVRNAVGLPPLAWRQNYRIAKGRRLLREGHSIAETATSLGFADQSHFHRVFQGHVAASPGGYRG